MGILSIVIKPLSHSSGFQNLRLTGLILLLSLIISDVLHIPLRNHWIAATDLTIVKYIKAKILSIENKSLPPP